MTQSVASGVSSGLAAALLGPLPAHRPPGRLFDVDAVRGLAILLVVVGHVVARDMPADNEWYAVLKGLIYRFHMPLFMVLAGLSFGLSLPDFPDGRAVARYSWAKALRLIVPYLFFGTLVLAGKLVAAGIVHVDNPPRGSVDDVLLLIVRPNESAAGFLWFIYVLGLYYLVLPVALHLLRRRLGWLMLASLLARLVAWPRELLLDEAVAYLPCFVGGMALWSVRERWERVSEWVALAAVAGFALALVLAIPWSLSKWVVGAASVPAGLALAQHLPAAAQRALASIGRMSFSIYLMNTVAIGLAKGLLLRVMPWDGVNFLLFFPVLTLAGVALPMAVKSWTERRWPCLNRYV